MTPAKPRRHRWGDKVVFAHKSERECLRGCGTVKVTFHEMDGPKEVHWVEFWRGLDKIAGAGEPTPVCEAVEVTA